MVTQEKKTFFATYDWARTWRDLPWAHEEATLFLAEICHRRKPGRALDIGCGAGTDSVFLASRGWDVTALDFMPKALEYTRRRAEGAGVTVTPVEADITDWEPTGTYDLVLDHGLLHNVDPVRHPSYRATLLKTLGADADFVLLHWHPGLRADNGNVAPGGARISGVFAPDLQERFLRRRNSDLPDLVGGGSAGVLLVQPQPAHFKPRELLAQIERTLQRHQADVANLRGDGRPAGGVAGARGWALGISTRAEPAAAPAVLEAWARHAGEAPGRVSTLLANFASEKLANVCNAGAPKCGECDVQFCKRLRYR
jgi:SAM-dependent methyltransferase